MTDILIVDDDPLFASFLEELVKSAGYSVKVQRNALSVVKVMVELTPRVTIMDINMPGMTGLDLLCKIKAEPPPVPVCMMTAYGNDAYRRRAEECQCDGYLTKPIDFKALKERNWAFATGQEHQP